MTDTLSLAYSTCPNDTFIFHALAHKRIDLSGLDYRIILDDVETLNQKAANRTYDVSKLSFATIGNLQDQYALLRTGAALGRGCGPMLIAKPGYQLKNIKNSAVAVPGLQTTANLLLGLWASEKPDVTPMVFDQVIPSILNGSHDFGVIIHESRFTYQDYGLECVVDLGQWWEETTGLPIPLGGIAVSRSLPTATALQIEKSIGESVAAAFADNGLAAAGYIREHAKELDESVINQHINLYVNHFSQSLGAEGEKAIHHLFDTARSKGVMKKSSFPLFLEA